MKHPRKQGLRLKIEPRKKSQGKGVKEKEPRKKSQGKRAKEKIAEQYARKRGLNQPVVSASLNHRQREW